MEMDPAVFVGWTLISFVTGSFATAAYIKRKVDTDERLSWNRHKNRKVMWK